MYALPPSQLVVTTKNACLLGYAENEPRKPRIDCWVVDLYPDHYAPGGRRRMGESYLLPAENPTKLATINAMGVCALDGGHVRCWNPYYQGNPEWKAAFPDVTDAVDFAADTWGAPQLCAWNAAGKVTCGGWLKEKPIATVPSTLKRVDALAEGVACGLGDSHRYRCETVLGANDGCSDLLERAQPDFTDPKQLQIFHWRPNGLVGESHGCYACALNSGSITCWGDYGSYIGRTNTVKPEGASTPSTPTPTPLFAPEQPSFTAFDKHRPDLGLLLTQGRVWELYNQKEKIDLDEVVSYGKARTHLPHTLLAAASEEFFCGVDTKEVSCYPREPYSCEDEENRDDCEDQPGMNLQYEPAHKPHRQIINGAGLENLARDLREIAPKAYRLRAEVLRAAADLAEAPSTDSTGRLFVVEAIAPIVEDTSSTYFATEVVPAFQLMRETYRARYAISGLRDFKESQTGPALKLLTVALPLLRQNIADTAGYGTLLVRLADALAKPTDAGARQALATAAQKLGASFDQVTEPSAAAVVRMVRALLAYLG